MLADTPVSKVSETASQIFIEVSGLMHVWELEKPVLPSKHSGEELGEDMKQKVKRRLSKARHVFQITALDLVFQLAESVRIYHVRRGSNGAHLRCCLIKKKEDLGVL